MTGGPAGPVPDARRLRLGLRADHHRAGTKREGRTISEELVIRFFAALEAGDIETLREIYAPDAVIWHNDDLIEQPVNENLKVLQGLHRAVSGLRYDIVRRASTGDGVLQQHVLRGLLPDGTEVELHAAMYLQVRDGRITRIEEYLDSARRSSIRAAREALPG
jgi:ketosteroid isomerase-like protein